jgi:hypothetical protein
MSERTTLEAPDASLLQGMYERGFVGSYWNPLSAQKFGDDIESLGGTRYGEDACRQYNIEGVGAGKLSLPFMAVTQRFPLAIPGRAQERGDCVSFSTRTALLISYMSELMYGSNPDRHSVPEVSETAERSSVIATEPLYWYRAHGGDGWQCAEAADVALTKSAMWLRKDYPELQINLTNYSPQTAGKWGATPPPQKITEVGRQNLCRNATVCRTYEAVRDMLATGNALSSCGSEAFDSTRDKYGVAKRSSKKWYHAMAYGAVDDRPETVARFGCGLVLVINSWGSNWISGNTLIDGTQLHIPQGCFWAKWSDISNRYAIAMGASVGWPARLMPDWGLRGILA